MSYVGTHWPEKTKKCVLGHICVSQKKGSTTLGVLNWYMYSSTVLTFKISYLIVYSPKYHTYFFPFFFHQNLAMFSISHKLLIFNAYHTYSILSFNVSHVFGDLCKISHLEKNYFLYHTLVMVILLPITLNDDRLM